MIRDTAENIVPMMPKNGSDTLNNLLKNTTIIMVPMSDVALPYVAKVLYTRPSQFNAIRVKLYSLLYEREREKSFEVDIQNYRHLQLVSSCKIQN